MYISINWVKDFVDLDGVDIDNLINRFTLSTAEVEGVQKFGYDINGVVVGQIKEVQPHPKSDKLKIVKVDIGNKVVQSLCGAPIVEVGQIIPFAPIGSKIGEVVVNESIIADEKSEGICLSEKELGISDDHSGLMKLGEIIPDAKPGDNIKDIMPIEDIVFEVDNKSLTHRSDLWGVYGIAREISALTHRPLKELSVDDLKQYAQLPGLNVRVEDEEKCYRYTALAIENITKKISNITMRIRLYYSGLRPINLLADITNYVMQELGQPMHAFDKKLVDHVNIRTLNEQSFTTLDGIERTIYYDTLMICTDDKPMCIAGIMGGEESSINDNTNSLFLESANFNPVTTRKTAIKLGLRTDSSSRYEKTLDPEMCEIATARYIYLLKQADKDIQIVSNYTDVYVKKYDAVKIEIDKDYINRAIGIEISVEEMKDILISLGFGVEVNGDKLIVDVPSYRATKDIGIKADLMEEIARIYGYDNIVPQTKVDPLRVVLTEESQIIDNKIKDILSEKYNASEVHTYVWYDKKDNIELKIETQDNIKIINSLNAENNILRYSMIPSLLGVLNKNIRNYDEVNIFEIGKVWEYPVPKENCIEKKHLGIVLSSKIKSEKEMLILSQEVIYNIFRMNKNVIPTIVDNEKFTYNWINPINAGEIKYGDNIIGYVSVLNLLIKNNMDKKSNVVIIEMDLEELLKIEKEKVMYKDISKYPVVDIDLSLVVDKNIKFSTLEEYINNTQIDYLLNYSLKDIYENAEKLGDRKSITISFKIGSYDKTLTNEEINKCIEDLIKYFETKDIIIRR